MRALLSAIALTLLALSAQAVPLQEQTQEMSPALEPQMHPDRPPPVFVPEADRAQSALDKGLWAEAFRLSVKVMAAQVPDVNSLGILALSAAVLGEQTMRDAALNKLLQVEGEPRYYHPLVVGVADLVANRPEAAGQRFDEILSRIPDDPLAQYFRGRTLEQGGKAAAASHSYQAALRGRPDFAPALAALAQLRSAAGAHGEAVALVERAVTIDPANPAYLKLLAAIYEKAGQPDKAREIYADLLKTVPGTMEAMLNGAWNLLRVGRAGDVRAQVDRITRLYGPQPLGHLLLAMAAADLRQYGEIPSHVSAYLRAKGKEPAAVASAGLVYIALGDGKGAVRLFEFAGVDPAANAQAAVNLAVARQIAGQPDKAEGLIKQAAATGESPELLALLSANLALARGDLAGYRSMLGQADAFLPGVAGLSPSAVERLAPAQRSALASWRNAAVLMMLNGWNIPMQRLADRALAISPADPIALYLRGLALGATGHETQAAESFDHAARTEPGFISAKLALAHTLLKMSRAPEARALLARLEPLASNGRLLFQLSMLQQRAGNGEEARRLAKRALATADPGGWRQEAERLLAGNAATPAKGKSR